MKLPVFCAALAFLLVAILGISADIRPPTVITRALVAALGTACLTHMSARWLRAQRAVDRSAVAPGQEAKAA